MDPYQQQQHMQRNMQQQRHMMDRSGGMGAMYGGGHPHAQHMNPNMGMPMHHNGGGGAAGYPMQMQQHGAGMMGGYPEDVSPYLPTPNMGMNSSMAPPPQYGYSSGAYAAQPTHMDQRDVDLDRAGGKRHAPKGQWKTPPQMLFVKDKNKQHPPADADVHAPAAAYHDDHSVITPQQFAEGTQGLTLDTTLLAKMTGKDASQIGAEQIRNIMQHPELLSIYQKLQEEEERRQRRLERNRASARLRREKKKGLVETYEMEVSELETIVKKVKSHKFGMGNDKLLLEALSGEQKQSVTMTRDTKHLQTSLLLKQHSQNAAAIHQANEESWMLTLAATNDPEFVQLKHMLGLTEAQCAKLARVKNSVHNESTRLAIVEKCFAALHVHEWLHFPNSEGLVDLFRAPLNAQQLQKFVQWTRVNKQTIQHLQFVQPPADPKVEANLVFDFPREL